jgi:hypothetical protein
LAATLAILFGRAAPGSAEPPYIATCGMVRAFSEPTPTVVGSVAIGTATFPLHAGDQLPSTTALGAAICINQTVTTSGPVIALIAMPSPICGEVLGVAEAIPGQRGEILDIVTTIPGLRIGLTASPILGLNFPGRAISVCFEVSIDANGNALATRVMGAAVQVRIPTPVPAATLPSTATEPSQSAALAIVVAALALVALLIARRCRASAMH